MLEARAIGCHARQRRNDDGEESKAAPAGRAGRSPKVIQAASEIPDRALSSEQVADTAPAVVPAVLWNSSMRKAPTTVYTAGFQPVLPVANAK